MPNTSGPMNPLTRIRRFGGVLVLSAFSSARAVETPVPVWQHVIEGGGTIGGPQVRRGNGVVATRYGSAVWVTTDDGVLRILQPLNEDTSEVRHDPRLASGRRTECHSSISLSETATGDVQYAVYAVVDRPTEASENITSRVIAVYPSGAKRWEVTLEGIAVGTPQIGGDGQMVYITHNTWSDTYQSYMRGRLSVFRNDFHGMGGEVPMNGAGAMGFAEKDAPFGPASVVTTVGGSDEVYWGEAWDEGRASFGLLYRFHSGTFHVSGLARTSWSTLVAPTILKDARAMWFGGQGSCLHGWPKGHSLSVKPAWSVVLDPIADDATAPILSQPVVSFDGLRVCGASAGTSIFCLNATSGDLLWMDAEVSPTFTTSRLTSDGAYLYVIQHDRGQVNKYHTTSGRVVSEFNCLDLTSSSACELSVEAEFTVTDNGRYLFYSDRFGRIVALRFEDVVLEPTVSPSMYPTGPTATPSVAPSLHTSSSPSNDHSIQPTITSSDVPTVTTSLSPSASLSRKPSEEPTAHPSRSPSSYPTEAPTLVPTIALATQWPSDRPSPTRTLVPTIAEATQWPSDRPSPTWTLGLSEKPSGLSTDSPSASSSSTSVKLDYFKVDLDEILSQTEDSSFDLAGGSNQNSASPVATFFIAMMLVVLLLLVVLALGIVVGKVLQLRRLQATVLPTRVLEEDESCQDPATGRPIHRFSYKKVSHHRDEEAL